MKSSKVLIPPSNKKWTIACLIVAGLSLGIGLSLAILSSLDRLAKDSVPKSPKNSVALSADQVTTSTEQVNDTVQDFSSVYPVTTTITSAMNSRDMIPVEWSAPIELTRSQMFDVLKGSSSDEQRLKKIIDVGSIDYGLPNYSGPPEDLLYPDGSFMGIDKMWKQGEVKMGEFKGFGVYLIRLAGWNMGPGNYLYQIMASPDGKKLLLSAHDNEQPTVSSLGIDTLPTDILSVKLTGTVSKPKLYVNGAVFELTGSIVWGGEYIFDKTYNHAIDIKPIVTTDEGVPLFGSSDSYSSGCLAAVLESGLIVHYTSVINSQNGFEPKSGEDMGITWYADYKNDTRYLGKVFGGCGGGYCSNVVSSTLVGDVSDLIVVGVVGQVAGSDEFIYAPKDPVNHPLVKEAYDRWYDPSAVKKPSIEEMIQKMKVPIFFWKDPIGRWVEYGAESLIPQAECGKPVIYLYPTTSTQVSVKLPSFINVTVSDPQYPVNGWNVTANPNGDLVSRDDGKTYGSLYWEGTGVGYQVPKTGFIVKDGEVSSFLAKTLPKYGLNQKEMTEFMDFWVPRMVGAPYYQISFLTNEWSKVAPLNVTPRPQTSIRIFMDWKPLSRSKNIKAPTIVTPERNGFTLVEWGGLLYK